MPPLISICIPAYKNTDYLSVLLQSVAVQTFRDFEVVVSDDSPTDEVETLCSAYAAQFPLQYVRNAPPKGSPANWNHGIRLATGKWIKIMHDDDWFAHERSLEVYAATTERYPKADFIYAGYNDIENGKIIGTRIPDPALTKRLSRNPLDLFIRNFIGNPSTTLIRNARNEWYDEALKWVVDFEFYIRCLQTMTLQEIPEVLVCVGIHPGQITQAVFRRPEVEIPENLHMLNGIGPHILKRLLVYDYYWRLFRNLGMRDLASVGRHISLDKLPPAIVRMLRWQFRIPLPVLRIGALSKCFMAISYLNYRILH
ncbi:MAG TPA: glycosyltransferase family 2 protein [Ferruginibacter sp.]|nr:glycosyltransferase family 2 protein [Ferruginibacter sp.]